MVSSLKLRNLKLRNNMNNNLEDYNTLSGVRTKDTLSFPERRKLREKSNKTEEESMKLIMDDSWGGQRSTWGIHPMDRKVYNPNVEYFFVSYFYEEEGKTRWVRQDYLTRHELLDIVRDMSENYENYHKFEILSDTELDQKSKYMCNDGVERELTLREWRFGNSYQHISDIMRENQPDLLGDL